MLCENCKKREANVRYSENINGRKKEMHLCDICSEKLGVTQMDLNMPINFSTFFEDFAENFASPEFMPMFDTMKTLTCQDCGDTFDDIAQRGKIGCGNCYSTFEHELDNILKKIQGSNTHTGRKPKYLSANTAKANTESKTNQANQTVKKEKKEKTVEDLKEDLKIAIQEERYEDAAKLRDDIKKMS